MVDLSICVVTFNACEVLRECLGSICHNSHSIAFETILVDNASADGTEQMVCRQFPQVEYIRNETNLGFQKATNTALQRGKGRYLMWLNNDTVVLPGAFDNLVAFADAHPDIGVLGPKVLNRDGTLQKQCRRGEPTPWAIFSYYSGLAKLFPQSKFFSSYLISYAREDEPLEVDAVSGSCLMLRREVMDQIGLIDEEYLFNGDDVDYCYRAKHNGWKVYYYPGAKIIHYGGQGGSRSLPYKLTYEFHRAMWTYYRKHLIERYRFVIDWLVFLGIWSHCGLALAKNVLRKEKMVGSRKP